MIFLFSWVVGKARREGDLVGRGGKDVLFRFEWSRYIVQSFKICIYPGVELALQRLINLIKTNDFGGAYDFKSVSYRSSNIVIYLS